MTPSAGHALKSDVILSTQGREDKVKQLQVRTGVFFMKLVLVHMGKTNTVTSFPVSVCLSFPNLMHARGEWWNAE